MRIMRNPFEGHVMHPNSIEAYRDLDLGLRQKIVFDTFVRAGKSQTDRQILFRLTGDYGGDLNRVQPRITEMVQDEDVPIREIGKTVCSYSGKRVRVCMYEPPAPVKPGEQAGLFQ